MRKLILVSLTLLICTATAAGAQTTTTVKEEEEGTSISRCQGHRNGSDAVCSGEIVSPISGVGVVFNSPPKANGTRSSVERTSGPTKRYVPYNRLSTGPDGKACATTGYVEEGATPPDERLLADPNPREFNIPIYGSEWKVLEDYPPCPEQPRAPGQPPPVETPSMVAARYWERIPLPKPRPAIAPGRAITGKLAYLETKGELTHTYTNDTVLGPLEIVAGGSYTVDWGDGETTGPHSFEGKPWPDGEITHEYIDIGSYNVVVTERWTASWRLGGQAGTLRALQTTGRIDNFPVQQIQAVVGR
jgi:hypothetical protein